MKKYLIVCITLLFLSGCSGEEQTLETISDTFDQPVLAQMQQAVVALPEDASVTVLETENSGAVYLCDQFTVTLQTVPGGDLGRILKETTGFEKEELTLMQTQQDGLIKTQCVWVCAAEEGEQVGRLSVLDDGSYHYVLTCMADAQKAPQLQKTWQDLFDSFRLVSGDTELNTGS